MGKCSRFQSIGLCLTAAGRYGRAAKIQAQALEQARALNARRYEAIILGICAELALVEGRVAEALALAREGLAASEETSPGFAGPILFGLLALLERHPGERAAALAAGEGLLSQRGLSATTTSGSANMRSNRRSTRGTGTSPIATPAALAARTADEPLPYSDMIVERGSASSPALAAEPRRRRTSGRSRTCASRRPSSRLPHRRAGRGPGAQGSPERCSASQQGFGSRTPSRVCYVRIRRLPMA